MSVAGSPFSEIGGGGGGGIRIKEHSTLTNSPRLKMSYCDQSSSGVQRA